MDLLDNLLYSIIGFFSLLSAWFFWQNSYGNNERRKEEKEHYKNLWETLDSYRLSELPIFVGLVFNNLKLWFDSIHQKYNPKLSDPLMKITFIFFVVYSVTSFFNKSELINLVLGVILIVFLVIAYIIIRPSIISPPFFISGILTMFVFGVGLSLYPIHFGHSVNEFSTYMIYRESVLYGLNLLADYIVIWLFFKYLNAANKKGNSLYYFAFIARILIINIAISFFLVFFVDLLIDYFTNPNEIFWSIFARSANNKSWQIAPWFWYMHTTFVPILLFILILLLALFAKTIYLPIDRHLFNAYQADKPHESSARFCAFVAGVLGTVIVSLKWFLHN